MVKVRPRTHPAPLWSVGLARSAVERAVMPRASIVGGVLTIAVLLCGRAYAQTLVRSPAGCTTHTMGAGSVVTRMATPPPGTSAGALRWFALTVHPVTGDPLYVIAPQTAARAALYERGARTPIAFERRIPMHGASTYFGPPALALANPLDGRTLVVSIEMTPGAAGDGCFIVQTGSKLATQGFGHILLPLYFGLILALLLSNALIVAVTRERHVAWYVAHLAGLLCYQLIRTNFAWEIAWPRAAWNDAQSEYWFFVVTVGLHGFFCRSFLGTRRFLPKHDLGIVVAAAGIVAYPLLALAAGATAHIDIDPHHVADITFFFAQAVLVLSAAILRARAGLRPARFYLVSFPVLIIFATLSMLQWIFGIAQPLFEHAVELGTASEALLLSLAVGDRLRIERSLSRIVERLPESIVHVDRTGVIVFATPLANCLFGCGPGNTVVGLTFADLLAERGSSTQRFLRSILKSAQQPCPLNLRLYRADGSTFAAGARVSLVRSERTHRVHGFSIVLYERPESPATLPPMRLSVFAATCTKNGRPIGLTKREFELVALLALYEKTLPASSIIATIWPDVDETHGANSLYANLSRLRRKLGAEAIESIRGGYRLNPAVGVDVRDLQRLASASGFATAAPEAITELRSELAHPLAQSLLAHEWFMPHARTLEQLRRAFLERLGLWYVERHDPDQALAISAELIRLDGTDEAGYAIAIRANRLRGDRVAIARLMRECRHTLQVELGTAPSHELERLATLP